MNDMLLISIIVPIYNTAPYLDRCISSLIEQTHRNLEIILINDGSADNSLDICLEYAARDSRIQVISQENKGLGAARNAGLAIAKGDFIGFVDSDDYIAPHMMETLLAAAVQHDADFAGGGYYAVNPDTGACAPAFHGDYLYDTPIRHAQILDILRTVHASKGGNLLWFTCRNLYRRSILEQIGLRFFEGNIIEDAPFNLEYLANARCMVLIREPLYYYVQTPNSIIRKPGKKNYLRKLEDSHNLKIGVYQKYRMEGWETSMADYTLNHTLNLLIGNLMDLKQNLYQEVLDIIRSPMIRTGFALGTLHENNTMLQKLIKFMIRYRAAAICAVLIRAYQFLRSR